MLKPHSGIVLLLAVGLLSGYADQNGSGSGEQPGGRKMPYPPTSKPPYELKRPDPPPWAKIKTSTNSVAKPAEQFIQPKTNSVPEEPHAPPEKEERSRAAGKLPGYMVFVGVLLLLLRKARPKTK